MTTTLERAAAARRRLACRIALFLAAALLFAPLPAQAAKRVALVIGNDTYENVTRLQRARNDSRAMAEALAGLGFDVIKAEDVGRRAMSRAMVELEGRIGEGDTALIFFAGHGFAIDGTNFLLPVDVPAAGPDEQSLVRDAAFSVAALAERLQVKGAATTILILDACRDNPFAIKGKRSLAGSRGLAPMTATAEGMFVLFSAGAGQAALDRLGDTDASPNSVFTRTLLHEMTRPGASMVQIAKSTQIQVRKLAGKVGHDQTPAYYDQIIGELYLTPPGAARDSGQRRIDVVREGGGDSVLPPASGQRLASLPSTPQPIANFTRSNSGWMVSVSLPEAAIQFGYRVGETGQFNDPGFLDALDQRTGQRMPKTYFELPPDQGKTTLYVTWRDRRGEQADVFPINFDPTSALASGQKQILNQMWTSWIAFRQWQGMTVYFTHLISYRCAIQEVRYGFNDGPLDKVFKLPPCDPSDPHAVPSDAKVYMKAPPKTASMSVQLTYVDGTQSQTRRFNAPH